MMATYKVENTANGPRGFYREGGALVMLEAGETVDSVEVSDAEVKSAKAVGLTFTGGKQPEARKAT